MYTSDKRILAQIPGRPARMPEKRKPSLDTDLGPWTDVLPGYAGFQNPERTMINPEPDFLHPLPPSLLFLSITAAAGPSVTYD